MVFSGCGDSPRGVGNSVLLPEGVLRERHARVQPYVLHLHHSSVLVIGRRRIPYCCIEKCNSSFFNIVKRMLIVHTFWKTGIHVHIIVAYTM